MTPAERLNQTSAVILAGGLARRMAGADKGLQLLAGEPLIAHVLTRLREQVGPIFINANRNQADYATFSYPVIGDVFPGFIGPLAGLHAALRVCQTPYLASLPCDSPYFPENLIAQLHNALSESTAPLAVVRQAGRVHPVFCLCRRSVLPALEHYLARGERRFMTWLEESGCAYADFPASAEDFSNFNTLAALHSAAAPSA